MKVDKKNLEKSQIELTIEVGMEEAKPFLEKAARHLSAESKIEGFRPGKAPYDIVKQRFGEMAIYQEAMDSIVTYFYYQAVTAEKLDVIFQPKIDLEKFAPGNPIIFKATSALMPQMALGDYKKVKVEKEKIVIEEAEIDKMIEDLRKMQAKEALSDKAISSGNKVEINFTVFLDRVVIEDGHAQKFPVIVGDNRMIPGFEDQLIGLKAGEEKKFQLKFPDKYHNTNLAGKLGDFDVKVEAVFFRELPEITEVWAKSIGTESIDDLHLKLRKNLEGEKMFHEEQRVEAEMLKKIVELSQYPEIPDALAENETHRMLHEFEDNITQEGLNFEDYLKNIKKDKKELEEQFKPKALERVKTTLAIREIADKEKIEVKPEEIDAELKKLEDQVDKEEDKKHLNSEGYRQYVNTIIRNRKVIELLKKMCIS